MYGCLFHFFSVSRFQKVIDRPPYNFWPDENGPLQILISHTLKYVSDLYLKRMTIYTASLFENVTPKLFPFTGTRLAVPLYLYIRFNCLVLYFENKLFNS